ncbi:MAG TPA: ABC transporter ATP-binding protein [Candidatus Onthocola stercoravium]|nr:ABC transporter ATP-binding protein [Candidatus Onthocola stercoravium]
MKKLVHYLNRFHKLLVIAFVLAAVSAVLSIIAPDRLSDMTDLISDGLVPNISESTVTEIMSDPDISTEDKMEFASIMSGITEDSTSSEIFAAIDEMPESIQEIVKPRMDFAAIKSIAVFLAIVYVASAIFSFFQHFIMATVSNNFAKELRSKIITKINKLPLRYFDRNSTGDILSRVTNDVDTVAQTMSQSIGSLVGAITLVIGSVLMMFVTNWILALCAIVSSLLGFSIMAIILKKSQKYFVERQEELGNMNGHIEEIYSGHNVVKVYNGKRESDEKFDKLNDKVFNAIRKSQFLSGLMQPIMMFIGNFSYVVVCVVGAVLVTNNVISFGVIVAFIVYVRLFTNPLSQIAQAMTSLQSAAAASERIFEFLEEPEMSDESKLTKVLNREEVKGNVEFDHVKFGYDESRMIIKDFSAKVKPGQKIAIVGPTGAGKTTMVNLLMKFYEINSGDIKIDGVSINELKRENIHELFTMVLQDTWLFGGTIRENIVYNQENISDYEMKQVCKVVGVDHFIKSLPNSYDTLIEDNDSISSGQKQLITIARGMLDKAPFLILDEATSNVDTRTEELVQKAMDKLMEGKTSFIIAHRLSTIKNADLILVMNEGNIIEQGNHEELMKQNGFYANLYNSQFEKVS